MNKIQAILFALVAGLVSSSQASAVEPSAQYLVPSTVATEASLSYLTHAQGIVPDAALGPTLHFRLPEDLVGAKPVDNILPEIATNVTGLRQFQNSKITANCSDGANRLTCVMVYNNTYPSTINSAQTVNFLKIKFATNPTLLAQKLAQAAIFEHDPQGVLIIFH